MNGAGYNSRSAIGLCRIRDWRILTQYKPPDSSLLRSRKVWVDFVDHQQCHQKDCSTYCGEQAKKYRHRQLIGKIANDLNLERVVGVVCDDFVGDVAHNRVHDGSHIDYDLEWLANDNWYTGLSIGRCNEVGADSVIYGEGE